MTTNAQTRLPDDTMAAARALAAERGVSLSMLLRQALERELDGGGSQGSAFAALDRLYALRQDALCLVALLPTELRQGEIGRLCARIEALGRG